VGRCSAPVAALFLAVLGGACQAADAEGGATTSGAAVTVRTDRLTYRSGQAIVVTVRNGLAHEIVAATGRASCTIVSLDRRVQQRWVEIRNCYAGVPPMTVRIAAGATRRMRLPDQLRPGTYRVRLEYRAQGRAAEATSRTLRVAP
jgi:hypothetical protein